jgi:hypothetical protein
MKPKMKYKSVMKIMKVQWRSVMASVAEISAYLAKEKSM